MNNLSYPIKESIDIEYDVFINFENERRRAHFRGDVKDDSDLRKHCTFIFIPAFRTCLVNQIHVIVLEINRDDVVVESGLENGAK